MSIEMTKQSSVELIVAAVKEFKRSGQKIVTLIKQKHHQEALHLINQQQKNAAKIDLALKQCEEGYLNPEVAKRILIVRNQFRDERNRLGKLFHTVRQQNPKQMKQAENQVEDFDFQIESRLLREKQQSLSQVHKKIVSIQNVFLETEEMATRQGESLDIISDNLEKTKENTVDANKNLDEASRLSSANNKRCIWIISIASLLLFVIFLCIILKCLKMG